jgi:myo-inositol-1(or 4)-monophosphatase
VASPAVLRDAAATFAREAGAVLREGHGRTHRPERKGRIDLVTEYDRRSERLLLEAIARRFPDHAVLAEESGVSAATSGPPAGAVRWIVDPLDGTTNYAHNYPFFCVSIGVEVAGVLTAGAVYDPVRDEMSPPSRAKARRCASRHREGRGGAAVTGALTTSGSIRSGACRVSRRSWCARRACGATARRRSTSAISPPGASTGSGRATSLPGTWRPAC